MDFDLANSLWLDGLSQCGEMREKFLTPVNPKGYLTDILYCIDLSLTGRQSSNNSGGEVLTQFALMAGVERLFGWAGVSYRIRHYHKRISQRDRRSIIIDGAAGT